MNLICHAQASPMRPTHPGGLKVPKGSSKCCGTARTENSIPSAEKKSCSRAPIYFFLNLFLLFQQSDPIEALIWRICWVMHFYDFGAPAHQNHTKIVSRAQSDVAPLDLGVSQFLDTYIIGYSLLLQDQFDTWIWPQGDYFYWTSHFKWLPSGGHDVRFSQSWCLHSERNTRSAERQNLHRCVACKKRSVMGGG